MSSPDRLSRRLFLALALGGLAGCGFVPAYGPGSGAAELRNTTIYRAPASLEGFTLRGRLEERLGVPDAAAYLLDVDLAIDPAPVAVNTEREITRFTLSGTADWTLTETGSGASLGSGRVGTFTGYSTTGTTVATLAAEEDARRRLAVLLADLVVSDVTLARAP